MLSEWECLQNVDNILDEFYTLPLLAIFKMGEDLNRMYYILLGHKGVGSLSSGFAVSISQRDRSRGKRLCAVAHARASTTTPSFPEKMGGCAMGLVLQRHHIATKHYKNREMDRWQKLSVNDVNGSINCSCKDRRRRRESNPWTRRLKLNRQQVT